MTAGTATRTCCGAGGAASGGSLCSSASRQDRPATSTVPKEATGSHGARKIRPASSAVAATADNKADRKSAAGLGDGSSSGAGGAGAAGGGTGGGDAGAGGAARGAGGAGAAGAGAAGGDAGADEATAGGTNDGGVAGESGAGGGGAGHGGAAGGQSARSNGHTGAPKECGGDGGSEPAAASTAAAGTGKSSRVDGSNGVGKTSDEAVDEVVDSHSAPRNAGNILVAGVYNARNRTTSSIDDVFAAVFSSSDGHNVVKKQIDDAEDFRASLPDMSYGTSRSRTECCGTSQTRTRVWCAEVVKVNVRNRKQRRLLRLSAYVVVVTCLAPVTYLQELQ